MRRTARAGLRLAALGLLLTPAAAHATGGGATVTAPAPATSAADAALLTRPLTLTSSQLRSMQRRLRLRADGVLGARTRAALRRYQRARGLTITGRPDIETLRALGLKVADRYEARLIAQAASVDPSAPLPAPAFAATSAVDFARTRIGDPYVSGGAKPGGFDCSGLTLWAFGEAGIKLPRTSFEQYGEGIAVPKTQIQAGDLVFFDSAGPGASHVGVATSPTKAISATSHGVMEHAITTGYWGRHYLGARRLIAS
jgi:peptidoglycan DL-endopeptidase CwlO